MFVDSFSAKAAQLKIFTFAFSLLVLVGITPNSSFAQVRTLWIPMPDGLPAGFENITFSGEKFVDSFFNEYNSPLSPEQHSKLIEKLRKGLDWFCVNHTTEEVETRIVRGSEPDCLRIVHVRRITSYTVDLDDSWLDDLLDAISRGATVTTNATGVGIPEINIDIGPEDLVNACTEYATSVEVPSRFVEICPNGVFYR